MIPQGMRALSQARHAFTLAFSIAQKVAKATRIQVVADETQIFGVEFKGFGVLVDNLKGGIEKLHENGGDLTFVMVGRRLRPRGRILASPFANVSGDRLGALIDTRGFLPW